MQVEGHPVLWEYVARRCQTGATNRLVDRQKQVAIAGDDLASRVECGRSGGQEVDHLEAHRCAGHGQDDGAQIVRFVIAINLLALGPWPGDRSEEHTSELQSR